MRSNWRLYLDEFALATHQASGQRPTVVEHDSQGAFLTPFERKYVASGQTVWRLTVTLPHAPALMPAVAED